jgi:hypothetical protein
MAHKRKNDLPPRRAGNEAPGQRRTRGASPELSQRLPREEGLAALARLLDEAWAS